MKFKNERTKSRKQQKGRVRAIAGSSGEHSCQNYSAIDFPSISFVRELCIQLFNRWMSLKS